jgi:polar amino acid transport system permease protein
VCLARLYGNALLRTLAISFIDVCRPVQNLVVLIQIYYALRFRGARLSSFTSATIALSLVFAAFTAEVLRAGVEAVPRGQFEAASALGLSFPLTLFKVVLPQAMRIAVPPQTSNSVSLLKDTSLASVVAMPDLLKQATDAQAFMANPTPLIGAALIYLVLLLPMVRLVGRLERRAKVHAAR